MKAQPMKAASDKTINERGSLSASSRDDDLISSEERLDPVLDSLENSLEHVKKKVENMKKAIDQRALKSTTMKVKKNEKRNSQTMRRR